MNTPYFLICPNNFLAHDVREREREKDELEKEGQRSNAGICVLFNVSTQLI